MKYLKIGLKAAYQLQNPGGLVLICTKGRKGRYELAPVAWWERFHCVPSLPRPR
ncbi:MAG: hypothetical protein WA234_04035 [Rectinemataceae bacterium]